MRKGEGKKKGPKYSYIIQEDPSGGYAGEVLELSGCYTEGESVAEVAAKLDLEVADWLEHAHRKGIAIPEPRRAGECSGRLVLRLPRHLHTRAALFAEKEGVSLNQFIMSAVAESVGAQGFGRLLEEKILKQVAEPRVVTLLVPSCEAETSGGISEGIRILKNSLQMQEEKSATKQGGAPLGIAWQEIGGTKYARN